MKSMRYLCVIGMLLLMNSLSLSLLAQNCTPDTSFADAPLGLYPTPFDETVFPDGGLADFPATIGMPYDLTFTVKLTDRVNISPFDFDLDSFALDNMDAILGLPIGLDYACNPPNCVFPDSVLGCIIISGTPIEANRTGEYNLQVMGQLFGNGAGTSLDFDFPSAVVPGEYVLSLNRSDSLDTDDDGIMDNEDNCVDTPNEDQIDEDLDGAGAACDCDDTPETGASCVLGCQPFYLDEDGDGFGTAMDSIIACTSPNGYVNNKLDCDDENAAINPNVIEIENNQIDDNCDGFIDELIIVTDSMGMDSMMVDSMNIDSMGMDSMMVDSMNIDSMDMDSMMVDSMNIDSMDMDSIMVDSMNIDSMGMDSMIVDSMNIDSMGMDSMMVDSMGMSLMDMDGDGIIDSLDNCVSLANPDQTDMDGDGLGAACDCDDSELIGFNCSDGCLTFYADNDGDGFGNPNITRLACTAPTGFVLSGTDCDDTDPNINPMTIEIPDNGIDENCNDLVDESNSSIRWFLDEDGDGFGNPAMDSMSIVQPRNYVANSNDCDDTNELVYESAIEIVDNLDNNCDGFVDNFAGTCDDVTAPGIVGVDQVVCPENPNPSVINNIEAPSGGSGDLEIMWMMTTDNPDNGNAQWMLIPNSHALAYTPPALGQTTYFRRCVRRAGCSKFLQESNIVTIAFGRVCEQIVEIIDEEEEEIIVEEEEEEEEEEMEEEFDPCVDNPILVTAEVADPDCNISNGFIHLTITGGTAPYSFAWEPAFGDINELDSLPGGIYSVTVLDSLNCFTNFSEILAQPDTCMSPPGLAPGGFEFGRVQANVIDGKIVSLEWETKQEAATGSYLLEHSKTGADFKALALGKKATGRSESYYQVNDLTPTLGTSFYRVKYVQANGDYIYSPSMQVLITPEGAPLFIAYPNPFGEQLTIDFLSPLEESVSLVILDNLGQTLHAIEIPAGVLRQTIQLPEAAKGLFTFQVATAKTRWVKKIMKVE